MYTVIRILSPNQCLLVPHKSHLSLTLLSSPSCGLSDLDLMGTPAIGASMHLAFSHLTFFFLEDSIIYMKGRVTERQEEKDIFNLLVHSPNDQKLQPVEAMSQECYSNLSPSLPTNFTTPITWAILYSFPRQISRQLVWQRSTGEQTRAYIGYQHRRKWFNSSSLLLKI